MSAGDGALPPQWLGAAERVFGASLGHAQRYARLLATHGIERGLLGPREAPRVWDRHLLNSAVVADLLPPGALVVDVGSGAGLPGLPIALARPDVRVVLLEPLLRRTRFLREVVTDLSLDDRVVAVRGRAPDDADALPFQPTFAVARAVAALPRLVSWTMPLVPPGGALLALRGSAAHEEVLRAGSDVARWTAAAPRVLTVGADVLEPPATVVEVVRRLPVGRRSTRR